MVVLQRPPADGFRRTLLVSHGRLPAPRHAHPYGIPGLLLDHQTEKIYTEQARTAGNPSDGRTNGFGFNFGNWQLQGTGAEHAAKMAGKDFALDLKLKDALQPVLHQAPGTPVAGLLDFGSAGKSYYTSRPRMTAQGTLSIGGTIKAVRGEVWFDHQWGDFEAASLRWNWFALQLGDGADLMLFELFDRQGAQPFYAWERTPRTAR
jgi:predicted secreted hydrolase